METISALLALCEGNRRGGHGPVTGGFSPQRPMTRSFGVFFDLRPNRRFSKIIETLVIWDDLALNDVIVMNYFISIYVFAVHIKTMHTFWVFCVFVIIFIDVFIYLFILFLFLCDQPSTDFIDNLQDSFTPAGCPGAHEVTVKNVSKLMHRIRTNDNIYAK